MGASNSIDVKKENKSVFKITFYMMTFNLSLNHIPCPWLRKNLRLQYIIGLYRLPSFNAPSFSFFLPIFYLTSTYLKTLAISSILFPFISLYSYVYFVESFSNQTFWELIFIILEFILMKNVILEQE